MTDREQQQPSDSDDLLEGAAPPPSGSRPREGVAPPPRVRSASRDAGAAPPLRMSDEEQDPQAEPIQ